MVQGSQAVRNPRTKTGKPRQYESRVLEKSRRTVHIGLRHHRWQKRHVVDALGKVRHQVTHPLSTFAILLPAPWALHHSARLALEQFDLAPRAERFTML